MTPCIQALRSVRLPAPDQAPAPWALRLRWNPVVVLGREVVKATPPERVSGFVACQTNNLIFGVAIAVEVVRRGIAGVVEAIDHTIAIDVQQLNNYAVGGRHPLISKPVIGSDRDNLANVKAQEVINEHHNVTIENNAVAVINASYVEIIGERESRLAG